MDDLLALMLGLLALAFILNVGARCIGAGFAQMEGVAVLREVLRVHDVATPVSDVPKVRNITSVPRDGARIRVTRR